METKCECGGKYKYVNSRHEYFAGTRLECEFCNTPPPKRVVVTKKLELEDVPFIHTKSDFAKLIGIKPQSVDAIIRDGRAKLLIFAKKEFVFYDK